MNVVEDRAIRHSFTVEDAKRFMEAGAGPAETLRFGVRPHTRKVVDLPSRAGFFTLDRTQGLEGNLVVTEYEISPQDHDHLDDLNRHVRPLDRQALVAKALSDWESTSLPKPAFEESWGVRPTDAPERVKAGSELRLMALRGNTPVIMLFEAL